MSRTPVICHVCRFETGRLFVSPWRAESADDGRRAELMQVVSAILTGTTTRALPTEWQGDYTPERARAWIGRRDAEGPTLLVTDRSSGAAIGFMILYEKEAVDPRAGLEVRLGYVIAEQAWARDTPPKPWAVSLTGLGHHVPSQQSVPVSKRTTRLHSGS